ncbi:MAG: hypothetical protein QM803_05590 [Rhodocyclaceae bacterium]
MQITPSGGSGFGANQQSFLQIGRDGSVNVSKLQARPHVTAGCGGFVDITSRAKRIVFSGYFTAGAELSIENGKLKILREGKVKKLVDEVDHVTFSGTRAIETGQKVLYVTERCVLALTKNGLEITEVAPGIDIQRDLIGQCSFPLAVSKDVKEMNGSLFRPENTGLSFGGQ